jgi:hypothetical protein
LNSADQLKQRVAIDEFDRLALRECDCICCELSRGDELGGAGAPISQDPEKLSHGLDGHRFSPPTLALHERDFPISAEHQIDASICSAA